MRRPPPPDTLWVRSAGRAKLAVGELIHRGYDLSREWQFRALDWAMDVHVAAVILLALLVPAHALAALKHHFIDRDDVFEGMFPEVLDHREHPQGSRHTPPPLADRPDGGRG